MNYFVRCPRSRLLRLVAALGVHCVMSGALPTTALAVEVDVTFCVKYRTNFVDAATGDFWVNNYDRDARGVRLVVEKAGHPDPPRFEGFVDQDGCEVVQLTDGQSYQVYSEDFAEVNGVEVNSLTVNNETHFFYAGNTYLADGDATVRLEWGATSATNQLAVLTYMLNRNDFYLGGAGRPIFYQDDTCCSFDEDDGAGTGMMHAATYRKFSIARTAGLAIPWLHGNYDDALVDLNSGENSCDGDNVAQSSIGLTTKEYQSAAAKEGLAEFLGGWAWNDETEQDCEYEHSFDTDFDLDGTEDNTSDFIYDCNGIPTTGLQSYVTATDWLEDLVNGADAAGCGGTTTHRSSVLDWARYLNDMLTDGDGSTTFDVPVDELVRIYNTAGPDSWDPDDNTGGSSGSTSTADDVIVRWEWAADGLGWGDEHDAQKHNGQDH